MMQTDQAPALRGASRLARFASAVFIWAALAIAPQSAAAATNIQRVVSPGGIEAWLVEERAIPIISIGMSFRGGSSLDPEGLEGRAELFAGMLEEGAGPYDAAAFADAADAIAAKLSFSSSRDSVSISASMLADKRDESLELLRLALTEPRFEAEPLTRVKAQIASIIRSSETDPDSLASKAWFSALYPSDPYGRPSRGTLESAAAVTAEDLRAAQAELLNRSQLVVGVVGAISAEELAPALDRLFGGLESADVDPLPMVEVAPKSGIETVEFDAPQSTVLFGHQGPLRDDPDFIPAYVMNYILGGGGFSSRLTIEVREKRGLAYGVYSYLAPLDRSGLYLGGVATANERVAESIDLIRSEWRRMAENGVTEEELDGAKRYLTGAYPLRFDSNGKIASFLVGAQLDGLGIDYIEKRNAMVEAVTVDDIKRVAARLLKPDELFFTVVGKPAGL